MNFFQDVLAQLTIWAALPKQWLQAYPFLQTGIDAMCVTLPLAALLAFAGLGFVSAMARILSITRKRSSYDKCARQLAMLALILGWSLLIAGRVWLFFVQDAYTPDSLPDFMVELSWILLGLAVLISSLYFALWKFLVKVPVLHIFMGIVSSIQACIAVAVTLGATRMLSAYMRPDASSITLGDIFFPGWLSPFWFALYWTLPLALAMAGAGGAMWLAIRRKREDFGRDHYNTMIPWCTLWARNAWTIFWLIFLGATVAEIQQGWQGDAFTGRSVALESIKVLIWLVPPVLWTIVARSAAPMRHKLSLLLALLIAVAFMLPYYSQVTDLSSLKADAAQETLVEPLDSGTPETAPQDGSLAAPEAAPQQGDAQETGQPATPDASKDTKNKTAAPRP